MYYGKNITAESLGGSPVFDKLALTYMILRIVICAYICLISSFQLILEIKYQNSAKNLINPRFLAIIGIIFYPLFRILYTISFIIVGNEAVGSAPDLFSFWSLFFQFYSWTWVGAYWGRLLLALFSVIFLYDRFVWISSWIMVGTSLLYVVIYHIISFVKPNVASTFFVGGFLAIVLLYGGLCVTSGLALYKQIKEKEELLTEKVRQIISRVRNLAASLIVCILIILVRDLIFYVILGIPMYSVYKHISNVITMIIEFIVVYCIMVTVSEKPINFLKFKCINPSLVKRSDVEKAEQHSSNSSSITSGSHKSVNMSTLSANTTTSSSSSGIISSDGGGGGEGKKRSQTSGVLPSHNRVHPKPFRPISLHTNAIMNQNTFPSSPVVLVNNSNNNLHEDKSDINNI